MTFHRTRKFEQTLLRQLLVHREYGIRRHHARDNRGCAGTEAACQRNFAEHVHLQVWVRDARFSEHLLRHFIDEVMLIGWNAVQVVAMQLNHSRTLLQHRQLHINIQFKCHPQGIKAWTEVGCTCRYTDKNGICHN